MKYNIERPESGWLCSCKDAEGHNPEVWRESSPKGTLCPPQKEVGRSEKYKFPFISSIHGLFRGAVSSECLADMLRNLLYFIVAHWKADVNSITHSIALLCIYPCFASLLPLLHPGLLPLKYKGQVLASLPQALLSRGLGLRQEQCVFLLVYILVYSSFSCTSCKSLCKSWKSLQREFIQIWQNQTKLQNSLEFSCTIWVKGLVKDKIIHDWKCTVVVERDHSWSSVTSFVSASISCLLGNTNIFTNSLIYAFTNNWLNSQYALKLP